MVTISEKVRMLKTLAAWFWQWGKVTPNEGWATKAAALEEVAEELSYRDEKQQIIKSGVTCCGTCGHRVKDRYTYCNHCGQKQLLIGEGGKHIGNNI